MKRTFNSYCKKNFIDYNFLVDECVQMSHSYNQKNNNLEEDDVYDKKKKSHIENLLKNKEKEIFKILKESKIHISKSQEKPININNNNNSNPIKEIKFIIPPKIDLKNWIKEKSISNSLQSPPIENKEIKENQIQNTNISKKESNFISI
jgi:hypothetical protein